MDRCGACGATLTAGSAWCGLCFAKVGAEAPPAFPASALPAPVFRPPAPGSQQLPPVTRRTRWRKTPTTFGPAGRLVISVLLLVPLALMAIGGLADPFVWGGAGFYLLVVMPLVLRDVWKAGTVAVR